MSYQSHGRPFHGEFTSADASGLSEANSRFALYTAGNTPAAITLAANERVVITDIFVLVGATGLTVTLYDGANNSVAAGERILLGTFAANGGVSSSLQTPHFCQKNADTGTPVGYPKVKTSGAGQIDATIRGYIETIG